MLPAQAKNVMPGNVLKFSFDAAQMIDQMAVLK
jgi:hypothetical protein